MATGSPRGPIYETGVTGPDFRIQIREIRIFRKFFFRFFGFYGPFGTSGSPPDALESPKLDTDREIRFFEDWDFLFFRFFKPKTPTI